MYKSNNIPISFRRDLNFDLVVAGGGVAGVNAAIAGARTGLKTVLIQNRPVLGGPSSSECVKDYTLEAIGNDKAETLVAIEGNYTRRRVHDFDHPITCDSVKLTITATNGDHSARLCAIRIFR